MEWKEATNEARQLVRIAGMELGQPLEGASCLIFGRGELASALEEELADRVLSVELAGEVSQLKGEQYDLLMLLDLLPEGEEGAMMAEEGLVVDLSPMRSGDWTVYDPSAPYRRIRILRLQEKSQG